jgi:type I restriction enzyme, S subunit
MFGDPANNPKKWPTGKISDLLESASYGTSEKSESVGEFPVLRMNNLTRSGELNLDNLKYMDLPFKDQDRYLVKAGDVLFNRTNSAELVGKTAMVPTSAPTLAYAGYLVRLRVNTENEPLYLARFLNSDYAKRMLRGMCKSIIGMANINATEIQKMRIALPPLPLQQTFATRIQAIEALKSTHRTALAQLDALFASLQHRAFSGML